MLPLKSTSIIRGIFSRNINHSLALPSLKKTTPSLVHSVSVRAELFTSSARPDQWLPEHCRPEIHRFERCQPCPCRWKHCRPGPARPRTPSWQESCRSRIVQAWRTRDHCQTWPVKLSEAIRTTEEVAVRGLTSELMMRALAWSAHSFLLGRGDIMK